MYFWRLNVSMLDYEKQDVNKLCQKFVKDNLLCLNSYMWKFSLKISN
jgi:hypothetical protein